MRTEDLQNAYPNPPEDFHNAVLSSLYKLDAQSPVRYKKRRVMRVAVVCAIVAALGSFTVVAAATNFFGLFSEPVGKFGLHVGVTEEATASASDSLKAVKMKKILITPKPTLLTVRKQLSTVISSLSPPVK